MEFVVDPAIATKIAKMKQRVCWQGQPLAQRQIDQTCLALENASDHPEFSFLVIGDSGSGPHRGYNPQRQIVEAMLPHRQDCQFVLHTGDVIYLVGSSEYYPKNFIRPYREFLVGGDQPHQIAYDQMVFNLPFLPVPGNHDYYDLPLLYGVLAQVAFPIRKLLRSRLDFDVAWHGSYQGDAYARAFLDYLKRFKTPRELEQHLDRHYTAMTETGRCLYYQPGVFTRLPNRYYSFRMGGIDFFALDSNTFNAPPPLPSTPAGDQYRHYLEQQREDLNRQMLELTETAGGLRPEIPREADQLDDIHGKLEQLSEVKKDIDKQLSSPTASDIDTEQLTWLEQRLVQSWQTPGVRGRVLYFHHPPYVTEATKWHQAQTLAVRSRLQQVLDQVARTVGDDRQGRPVVDLVLNGHAHCLEYLRTLDTGHADAHTNWIVCGGSGYSLRRQRQEGPELTESLGNLPTSLRPIAKSMLYLGRTGHGSQKRHPYSFLRIDVQAGTPPKFVVRPYVAERFQRQWQERALEAFVL